VEFQSPSFSDPKATELWRSYFLHVDRLCKPLGERQRQDIILEIKAHLLESLLEDEQSDDLERLESAIGRLGDPDDYVPSWVEDRLRLASEPGSGFRNLYRLLRVNARKGIHQMLASLFFGFCYMLVFYLFTMAVLKGVFPNNIGLYTSPGGIPFIGFVDAEDFTEHLGWWLIPIGLAISTGLMWLLSILLQKFQQPR
jgi:hypothetical protein